MAGRVWMLFGALALGAPAHGVHASLTLITFIPETKSLEIVLVMSADDIETVLRRDTGKQVEVDRDAEALVSAYVSKTLELRDRASGRLALQWVGMEVSVQKITAYLEAKIRGSGPDGMMIRNDLLFDLLKDQVNILSVKRGGAKGRASEHLFQAGTAGAWQTVRLP